MAIRNALYACPGCHYGPEGYALAARAILAGLAAGGTLSRERLLVAVAAALLLHLVFFRGFVFVFPFPSGSNGVFFDEAWRLLAGQVMYRDFFEFVGPGTAHLDALVLALGGARIEAFGWAAIALGTVLAVVFHGLARRVARWPWRLLVPAAFLSLVYVPYTFGDHKWPALCCGALALAVLARDAPVSPGRLAGGGALLGAGMLFTQDLGLGILAGVAAFLAWRRAGARAVATLLIAAAAPLALTFAFFAWKAGAATVAYDWLIFPLTRYRELNPFRLTISPSLRTLPRAAAQLALAAAGIWGAIAELRRGRAGNGGAQLIALAGLGAFAATAHRGWYPMGLAVQSALLIPIAVRHLAGAGSGARLAPLRAAALAVIAAGVLHGSLGFVAWRQLLQPLTLEEHRAGRIWTARPMPELSWIESRTRPGDAVFLLPARGGHYFLTGTRDVTAFPYVIEGQHTVEQAQAALDQIEAARPAVGIWDQRPWPRSDPERAGPLDHLFNGLARRYRMERLPSGVFLLTRIEP